MIQDRSTLDDAIRHILFMYRDMAESYDGFGHNIDTGLGRFDAPAILDLPDDADLPSSELELLRTGAAIALLCDLSDAWDEEGDASGTHLRLITARLVLQSGGFGQYPEIAKAFELGFGKDETAFRQQLSVVYARYVRGYFARLAGMVPN